MDVLIVDDEPAILAWMCSTVKSLGLTPVTAANGLEALEVLGQRDVGFVITDLMMPIMDGAELVRRIRASQLLLPTVVMSGVGSVDDAVNLLRLGADDFLTKPIRREVLLTRLEQIIAKARIYEEARLFRRFVEDGDTGVEGLVTRSPAMFKVLQRLPQIARTDASVLVGGPSGSGKELFARAIHRLSKRAAAPFIAVNCGAIPENLVEATLFGHRKGAFTGAERDSSGLAREADGGTLFFDEVGDLPLPAQVKILRFLQTKELTPVGESRPVQVDVRIIAATHRNLPKLIAEGQFREDLFYRLNVIAVDVPPLDRRPEDVPILATHFLRRYAPEYASAARAFSPDALSALVSHAWSGNVRELENVVQRAIVACDGPVIEVHHLQLASGSTRAVTEPFGAPERAARPAGSESNMMQQPVSSPVESTEIRPFQEAKKDAIDGFERAYLQNLLRRARRMTDAAELAGIDRKGLWRLLKKHGLRSQDANEQEPALANGTQG